MKCSHCYHLATIRLSTCSQRNLMKLKLLIHEEDDKGEKDDDAHRKVMLATDFHIKKNSQKYFMH